MITLYGIPASQASRCLWALEELGLTYEIEIVRPYTDTQAPSLLGLNPNGKVPVLEDDEVVLWESLAINHYLAERYGAPLRPASKSDQAIALQWSFWVANEVEPFLWQMWQLRVADQPDEPRARSAEDKLRASLTILDAYLSDREWLVGGTFSIADLNLESYIIRARRGGYELASHPGLWAWIERCEARPARLRVRDQIRAYEKARSAT